jgi:HPt (histidine-containing phosphotransfer) domain-containing protein
LLDKARASLAEQIHGMGDAIKAGELGVARELAHRMKNTAGDIGLNALCALAGSAEQMLAADSPTAPDMDMLRTRYDEAAQALAGLNP